MGKYEKSEKLEMKGCWRRVVGGWVGLIYWAHRNEWHLRAPPVILKV